MLHDTIVNNGNQKREHSITTETEKKKKLTNKKYRIWDLRQKKLKALI